MHERPCIRMAVRFSKLRLNIWGFGSPSAPFAPNPTRRECLTREVPYDKLSLLLLVDLQADGTGTGLRRRGNFDETRDRPCPCVAARLAANRCG
jgi:hypothetical protein